MRARTTLLSLFLVAALAPQTAAAQRTAGLSADFMGYTFADSLGAAAAQLFMLPLGVRYPVNPNLTVDFSAAWAEGRVESSGTQYVLNGVVDTRAKVTYQATPWALVSFGATLPTGNSAHDSEEAVVASFLSADLLGFREASWGTGAGLTSSVATAMRVGQWGVGLAGAYSLRGGFQANDPPAGQTALTYTPGNETRLRIGIDRNIGTNTFTAGATVMNYSPDQAKDSITPSGRNLFQSGLRARFDATYLFRAGAGLWSVYVADVMREKGDLTSLVLDSLDAIAGQVTSETPSQNVAIVGFSGTLGIGGGYVFRPQVDLKYQTRKDASGSDQGSGWVMAAGGDFPIRLFGMDFFPKARALFGGIKDANGTSRSLLGMEFVGTIRRGF